ncbi:MAG: hypothetical protein Q9O62_10265 [Ardenticatenia bacterium]|nr:hypothetical protein [Ardenticatenia bacterium]
MPSWQPNWSDVRWNWAVAEEAAAELSRVADLLEQLTAQRRRMAAHITATWHGGYRRRFDDELAETVRNAQTIAYEYRRMAAAIRAASQAARAEQLRREAERRRWWEEKRREEEEAARRRRHR